MRLIKVPEWIFYFGLIGMAAYAVVAYLAFPAGSTVHPEMRAVYALEPLGIYAHVFASVLATLIAPFQLSTGFRKRHTHLHKNMGRVYLLSVLVGGLSGLYMAFFAYGGLVSTIGFIGLSVGWLYTGWMAFISIRRKEVGQHKQWMILNASLTFAAVTFRAYLGVFFATGISFDVFYPLLTWISWIPNLLVAIWWNNRPD